MNPANNTFTIGGRALGRDQPVYIVAELSANHAGDFETAARSVEQAAKAGADAIKVQTYTADTLTIDSASELFRVRGTLWEGRTLYELYEEASMRWEWQPKLQAIAREQGIDFFSAAFDPSAIAFLEQLDVPVHKSASPEIVDLPLIEAMARTGKPLIISTGMASLDEIGDAVEVAREGGASGICLLKCTSSYPAPPSAANLRSIPHLAELFGCPVGLSDHTLGTAVSVAAVALGACLIEKHFTLSRSLATPDSAFSLEPDEFADLVSSIRDAQAALGEPKFGVDEAERPSLVFRRSLFAVQDIAAGENFSAQNVRSIRPGNGLPPKHLSEVIGQRAARDIPRGTPLDWTAVLTVQDG